MYPEQLLYKFDYKPNECSLLLFNTIAREYQFRDSNVRTPVFNWIFLFFFFFFYFSEILFTKRPGTACHGPETSIRTLVNHEASLSRRGGLKNNDRSFSHTLASGYFSLFLTVRAQTTFPQ